MERLFGPAAAAEKCSVGDASLQGRYQCDYCREPYAQRGRFQVPVRSSSDAAAAVSWTHSFCTPECAAGYGHASLSSRYDHALLEQRHSRRIQYAPPPAALRRGLWRSEWLLVCRAQLDEAEMRAVEMEMVVQHVDVERMTQYKKVIV
jgi:hypothetical protein